MAGWPGRRPFLVLRSASTAGLSRADGMRLQQAECFRQGNLLLRDLDRAGLPRRNQSSVVCAVASSGRSPLSTLAPPTPATKIAQEATATADKRGDWGQRQGDMAPATTATMASRGSGLALCHRWLEASPSRRLEFCIVGAVAAPWANGAGLSSGARTLARSCPPLTDARENSTALCILT